MTTDPIRLVLDTNVVIDWLVFDHPFMAPLRDGIAAGEIVVLSHELAAAELDRVLGYPELRLEQTRQTEISERYRRLTRGVIVPSGFAMNVWRLPERFPRCRDPDDDLFLALAYHAGLESAGQESECSGRRSAGAAAATTALVTRDKLLLKMRKRVRKHGMTILDVQQLITQLNAAPATA